MNRLKWELCGRGSVISAVHPTETGKVYSIIPRIERKGDTFFHGGYDLYTSRMSATRYETIGIAMEVAERDVLASLKPLMPWTSGGTGLISKIARPDMLDHFTIESRIEVIADGKPYTRYYAYHIEHRTDSVRWSQGSDTLAEAMKACEVRAQELIKAKDRS